MAGRAVDPVPHVPDTRDAREPRRDAAVEGGLQRVRVHDVGTQRAQAPGEPSDVAGGAGPAPGAHEAGRSTARCTFARLVELEHLDRGAGGVEPGTKRTVLGEHRVHARPAVEAAFERPRDRELASGQHGGVVEHDDAKRRVTASTCSYEASVPSGDPLQP